MSARYPTDISSCLQNLLAKLRLFVTNWDEVIVAHNVSLKIVPPLTCSCGLSNASVSSP